MNIEIHKFADLFKTKARIFEIKYLGFWEEIKWLH